MKKNKKTQFLDIEAINTAKPGSPAADTQTGPDLYAIKQVFLLYFRPYGHYFANEDTVKLGTMFALILMKQRASKILHSLYFWRTI